MTFVRRRGESGSGTQGTDRSKVITWFGPGQSKDLPPLLGFGGLPNIGFDTHPDDPSLIARSFNFRDVGPSNVEIDVTYASQRFSGGTLARSTPDLSGNRFMFGASFEIVSTTIPYAVLDAIDVNSGDLTDTAAVWVIKDDIQIAETRSILYVEYEINGFNSTTMAAFANQNNKIHTFAGRDWLFNVSSIRPIENNSTSAGIFEVRASWELDEGTREIAFIADDKIKYPGAGLPVRATAGNQPQPGFIRDPYSQLRAVPGPPVDAPAGAPYGPPAPGDDGQAGMIRNGVPQLIQVPQYSRDPNGYNSLPLPPGVPV